MNVNPAHRDHDELLIARLAAGDADAVDQGAGERQLGACPDCRALLADISAIRGFTTRETLRVPPRPRSFRIPADELQRLGTPAWRRWLARFGAPRFDLLRPLATAVAGLGLIVVVLGSVPVSLPSFGFAAAGVPGTPGPAPALGVDGSYDRSSAPSPGEGTAVPGASAQPGRPSVEGELSSPEPSAAAGSLGQKGDLTEAQPTPVPLVPLGAVVLVSGLGLVVLSTAARRAAGR